MINILEENTVAQEQISQQYTTDKKNVENFLNGKSPTFNFASLKRMVMSELVYNHSVNYRRICGFTRKQIINMVQAPERYGNSIIRLSQYMMLKSGYYKRLIEYFVNMGVINWTIDTEVNDVKFYSVNENTLKSNFVKYSAQCNKFKLDRNIIRILRKLYIEDACFGFVTETDVDISIFFIDPKYCQIQKLVNGDVYEYAVDRSLLTDEYIDTLPFELQELLLQSREISLNNLIMIPYENSLCLKYNNDFTYLYPPFFNLIADILLIDDYKDLAKAKTEADAYKLVYFKIPTNDEGQMTMGDETIIPFVEMAKQIVPETWGVVPSPMELQLVESKSTVSDDTNKVETSVEDYYSEAGVSKALISSASSGSELKLSMKVDSSDLYRIYKQIESWVDLQMKLKGFIYKSYQFIYSIIPMTIFDTDDVIDRELKLAQVSVPNKAKLLASSGINTSKMLGNSYMENNIFADMFDNWKPLASSYTQSGKDGDVTDKGGNPGKDDGDIAESTDTQRNNDSNSTDNRI